MKNIYILIISLTLGMNTAFAQSSLVKKADKYYNRLQYVKAAEAYEKIVANDKADDHVYQNLADSYYQIFDTKNAEKYYAILANKTDDPEVYYRYAQMLKANGKYKESVPWMKKFAQMKPADHRAISFREHPVSQERVSGRSERKKNSRVRFPRLREVCSSTFLLNSYLTLSRAASRRRMLLPRRRRLSLARASRLQRTVVPRSGLPSTIMVTPFIREGRGR